MTRSPITALGRTRPRNLTNSGALSAEKMINGRKRVVMVPSTTTAMVIICCVVVIMHFPHFRSYYLCCNNEAEDYATAENYCKEQGGYLATITSEKENKFLFNYVRKKGYSSAYFGLNNLKDGKAYQWNNGELLIYTK